MDKINDKNTEKLDDIEIEKVSGGSLEHAKGGFRVFNSSSGKDFGTYKDYDEAVKVAKKHKISAMGTWGDDEIPWGLAGTGFTRKDVREKEDKTHEANKFLGTGEF